MIEKNEYGETYIKLGVKHEPFRKFEGTPDIVCIIHSTSSWMIKPWLVCVAPGKRGKGRWSEEFRTAREAYSYSKAVLRLLGKEV